MKIKGFQDFEFNGYDIVKDDDYYEIMIESYFLERRTKGGEIENEG